MKTPNVTEPSGNGIAAPSVSDALVNGSSRIAEHKASRMKPSNAPVQAPVRSQPTGTQAEKLPVARAIGSVLLDNKGFDDVQGASEDDIRTRFIAALTAHQACESSLVNVTVEAIEAGFDRDDCIQWGLDAGLSDGYVRATVSRLFIALVGRVKRKGGGRKQSPNAVKLAKLVLRWQKGSFKRAKAMLLAARRIVEGLEREADKE